MVGKTISHYRVVGKLGEGGMGVVYKAEDTNLGRTVALKLLAPHALEDPEYKTRFLREAKTAASLDHPNICTVYEIGEVEDQPFFSMALIKGQTVKDKIAERPLRLAEALDIANQAGEGLAAAHKQGIIHRDVKSANLMVTPEGQVKVMDFGLARAIGGSKVTKTGVALGTVACMSPEQAERKELDGRSDIWSLGVVVYEMMTGRLPFAGDDDQPVLFSIINEAHEPVTAVRAGVPLELDRILGKALAKNPAERYQHMEDMLVDLRALARAPETGPPVIVGALMTRRNVSWALAGALTTAAAVYVGLKRGGTGDPGSGGVSTQRVASIAVLPLEDFTDDPEQEYFSDGLTGTLIANLAKIGDLKVTSRTSVMRYKGTDKPLREIADELGVDAVIEGSAQRLDDQVRITAQLIDAKTDQHLWAETYDRSVTDAFRLQSDVAQEIARQINVTVTPEQESRLNRSREVNPEVYEAYLRGMYYVSLNTPEGFEKGMEYLHKAVEIDPAEPLAYAGLAEGYITRGHGGGERLDVFPRAKAAAEQALKLDPDMAEAVGVLAHVALYWEWDWVKAEEYFQRALELNPSLAMTHYHYAWYLALFDRLEEAIEEHKLARDLDPLRALHTGWLGGLYNRAGRPDEAIVEAEKSLELNPRFWGAHWVMHAAYLQKGMHEDAIVAAERLIELNPTRGNVALGFSYASTGRKDEALAIAAKLQDAPANAFVVAMFYSALGDKDAAFGALEAAYEIHAPGLPWIRAHPWHEIDPLRIDPLRDDPRFQDLMRRMNLPQ